ncbi:MAG: hypothetical protein IKN43_09320 [Selenomonadaceae bacterium]|nr:hypothetical protein [Selenomonadaceae bacterium]
MKNFETFLKLHSDAVWKIAKKNTQRSVDGHTMLPSNDPWMQETVWDDYFEKVDLYEKNVSKNKSARSLVGVG